MLETLKLRGAARGGAGQRRGAGAAGGRASRRASDADWLRQRLPRARLAERRRAPAERPVDGLTRSRALRASHHAAGRCKIGLSPRFLHSVPPRDWDSGARRCQYLEQSIAHWLMTRGRARLHDSLDRGRRRAAARRPPRRGLRRGARRAGAAGRSRREPGHLRRDGRSGRTGAATACATSTKSICCEEFVAAGKPVLGICRGLQLINVACGGTLYQDIALHHPKGGGHHDPEAYDRHFHEVAVHRGLGPGAPLPGHGARAA